MRRLGGAEAGEEPEDRSQQQPHGDEVLEQQEGHASTLERSSRMPQGQTALSAAEPTRPCPGRQERVAARRISPTT